MSFYINTKKLISVTDFFSICNSFLELYETIDFDSEKYKIKAFKNFEKFFRHLIPLMEI